MRPSYPVKYPPLVGTMDCVKPRADIQSSTFPNLCGSRRSRQLAQRGCGALLALLLLSAAAAANEPVDFARDVGPTLERSCLRCHQPGNEKGEISLATVDDLKESAYVVPGKPDESYLLKVISAADGQRPAMPKEGERLSAEELALVRRWIAEGAAWPETAVLRERSRADASWWSLQPLADVSPPAGDGLRDAAPRNAIDAFVGGRLAARKLEPNPPANRRTLLRRVTYDLTGLPPTPEELDEFENDASPHACERVVDRLLASPHYGERWGRHWLDVVRFGESNGFERNVLIGNLWPFRDYIIRSFNADRPFDRLAHEHLAGDVLGPGDRGVEIGTAFLVCGPYDNVGNQDPAQAAVIRANTIDEMIRATSEAFLGLTVGCARCHDHKFDPILQRDYYSLYATFAGVQHGERVVATPQAQQEHATATARLIAEREQITKQRAELEEAIVQRAETMAAELEARWTRPAVDRYGTIETFAPTEARHVRLVVDSRDDAPQARSGYQIDEFEVWTAGNEPRNAALATAGATAQGPSRVAEDFREAYSPRLTIDGRFGARWIAAGPELTITLARPERIERIVFSSDRPQAVGRDHHTTTFVGDYRLEVSLDGETWTTIASSADRQPPTPAHRRQRLIAAAITADERMRQAELDAELARIHGELAAVPPLPTWWVGTFQQAPGPFHVFLGGDPQRPGETVTAASLTSLNTPTGGYTLAADASERERRLALARWITASGNPLTPRVLANRLWQHHFGTGIVDTPSDFGYMGSQPSHPELLDWLARQVHIHGWRLKPLHRLIVTSHAYRQSSAWREDAANVDGDARLLWRFPPRRLAAEEIRDTVLILSGQLDRRMGGAGFRLYRYLEDNVATYVPLDEHGPATFRRSVYHQNARAARVDVLSDFDCPDPAFAAPRRAATTTPLQALTMMNHDFTLDMAELLAARLEHEAGDAPEAQIERAFVLAFGRGPDSAETKAAARLVADHGLRAFCRAVLNSNELIYLD